MYRLITQLIEGLEKQNLHILGQKIRNQDFTLLDPSPAQQSELEKQSIMDLRLTLSNGDMVNVELQTFNHKSFRERIALLLV